MDSAIVIVSLAPWARRSPWWRQVQLTLRAGLAERPVVLLVRYFAAGNVCGAISASEVAPLRNWASSVQGWKEHALRGQYPLRFTAQDVEDIDALRGGG